QDAGGLEIAQREDLGARNPAEDVRDGRSAPRDRGLRGFGLLAFLIASILYMEIVLRVGTQTPVLNNGLVFATLFAGATASLVFLAASFFRGVGRTLVVGLSLGVVTVLFMSQFIYYDIFTT